MNVLAELALETTLQKRKKDLMKNCVFGMLH